MINQMISPSMLSSDEAEESAGLSSSLKGTLPSSSLRKQRIRSRGNPPPELAQWLRTFQVRIPSNQHPPFNSTKLSNIPDPLQTWSHPERLLALDELVENCEPTQIRHLMHVIEPQFQRDFISLLPREVQQSFPRHLPPPISTSILMDVLSCPCSLLCTYSPSWTPKISCTLLRLVSTGASWPKTIFYGGRNVGKKVLMRRWSLDPSPNGGQWEASHPGSHST